MQILIERFHNIKGKDQCLLLSYPHGTARSNYGMLWLLEITSLVHTIRDSTQQNGPVWVKKFKSVFLPFVKCLFFWCENC